MPSILIFSEYASLNGGERSLLAVVEQVCRSGWSCQFAAPPAGPLAEAVRRLRLPLIPLVLHDDQGRRRDIALCRQRLAAILLEVRPDIVHANSLSMSRLLGPVADDCGVPSVGYLRDMMRISSAMVADLNRHRRLIAVSQATRDWYLTLGLDAGRVEVVYNGVDLRRFRPASANQYLHRELALPIDATLVGAIGQLGMRKGLDVLLRAMPRLLAAAPTVHLLLVGERYSRKAEAVEFERTLQRQAASPPLAGHCHFLGTRADVESVFSELTLLVHAARQEPLGRVLLEAAASGTATVATDVGGTREIFPDGSETALLVPPDDDQALAAAVIRLLADSQLRARLGRRARARAETAFDADHAAERLMAQYEWLLRSARL